MFGLLGAAEPQRKLKDPDLSFKSPKWDNFLLIGHNYPSEVVQLDCKFGISQLSFALDFLYG